MSTQSDMSVPDTTRPAFDPGLNVATVVFSHVQCVKTRVNLALVSKLWRDASKPAAAYPRKFDFGAFPDMDSGMRSTRVLRLLDNDEALSLPYERVVGFLGEAAEYVCDWAAMRGSVRLLKWTRENNLAWNEFTCICAARNGHLPALQYLHENGCPWNYRTCFRAAENKHWDCLKYAVDNMCPGWEKYAEEYAMHLSNGIQALDACRPAFDPGLNVATVVFSHVQCVKTRVNLALVSKLWRNASKPAAAYPLRFDFDAFPDMDDWTRLTRFIGLLDNDEALSLPYERVVGFLGEATEYVCDHVCEYAALLGSVRLLKWTRVNNFDWSVETCHAAALNGHLPALQYVHENGCPWNSTTCYCAAGSGHLPVLQYLHENGCPWDSNTCLHAAGYKHWDCLQYAVDNKCPGWETYAKRHAKHLR
jgi:hypothetical protein